MWNTILIIIAFLSLAFIVWLVVSRLPKVTNINVNNLPDIKLKRQKDAILKNRLQRLWQETWSKAQVAARPIQTKALDTLRQYYQKLKDAEKDLRRRGQQKLTTAVDRLQTVDEILTEAKNLINSEEYQKAEDILLDALNIDQNNVDIYKSLAEVYHSRKEYDQARETLEYILKLTHHEDAAVYSSLGHIARARGNLKQAEEDYLKSISLSDENYLYFLWLAEVYLDLDEKEKALEAARRGLILSENSPKILDFLINLCIIMPDKELALQYLNKLKEINPENNKISQFAEKIDELK